jgi:hypothetical protein
VQRGKNLTGTAVPCPAFGRSGFVQTAPRCRFCRALGSNAAPERLHEIDHIIMRRLDGRRVVRHRLRPLFAQDFHESTAVVILQHTWIEISRLRPDDMLRELHHLCRQLHLAGAAANSRSLKYEEAAVRGTSAIRMICNCLT